MEMVMNNRLISLTASLLFAVSCNIYAAPACPVQGLDPKVCPIVVDFFDDVAKNNPDFATHWKNHHWVGQSGNFQFQNLDLKISEHVTTTFTDRGKFINLQTFVNDVLNKAAKTDSHFQQVIDSHNFFVMTVQAMHLALQKGADRFNRSGLLNHSLIKGGAEKEELFLQATENYQKPTDDRLLNAAGLYFTTEQKGQHSVAIDSTTYKAGSKVSPVIISSSVTTPSAAVTPPTPKGPRATLPNQQKTVVGAGGGSAISPKPVATTHATASTSIQKQSGAVARARQGTPAASTVTTVSGSKDGKVQLSTQQKTVVGAGGGSAISPKPVATTHATASTSIQKQSGAVARARQGTPAASTIQHSGKSKTEKGAQTAPAKRVYLVQVPSISSTLPASISTSGSPKKLSGNSKVRPSSPNNNALQTVSSTTIAPATVVSPSQAIRPSRISVQTAPAGVNKTNVNQFLITQIAGNQLVENERTYLVDDERKAWSCVLSGLGYRVVKTDNDKINHHGHVESVHLRSTQLAHIPVNHPMHNGCQIAVSK
jgi:hypothetical protein